jgi:hypothetical protein
MKGLGGYLILSAETTKIISPFCEYRQVISSMGLRYSLTTNYTTWRNAIRRESGKGLKSFEPTDGFEL